MPKQLLLIRAATAALAIFTGCGASDPAPCAPPPPDYLDSLLPAPASRDLDLLFVIENAGDGAIELARNVPLAFPTFLAELTDPAAGLPNLHLGVITTDVGIGPYSTTICMGDGDDGVLQNTPNGDCLGPDGRFIIDVAGERGERRVNYPGQLADVFLCIARLASYANCALEQPLESLRRALDGHRPENDGFLRPGAILGVVFVAQEDDCSATDGAIFNTAQEAMSTLGAFSSFRCTEYGVVCDGRFIARAPAEYQECEPRRTGLLWHPSHYADFLRGLVPNEADLHVFALATDPVPLTVVLDEDDDPELEGTLSSEFNTFANAVRLHWFADQFADPPVSLSQPIPDALTVIAADLRRAWDPCLIPDIDTVDLAPNRPGLQLDCHVSQGGAEIPECPLDGDDYTPWAGGGRPCWWLTPTCASGGPAFHFEGATSTEPITVACARSATTC